MSKWSVTGKPIVTRCGLRVNGGCVHEIGDLWTGQLNSAGFPVGKGRYIYKESGLEIEGGIRRVDDRDPMAFFSGQAVMRWPNGDRYAGLLENSECHGAMGTFEWANGNRYTGAWARNKPHGRGVKWVRDPEELRLRAPAGAGVHMIRCEGTWKHGAMHGQGEIEFYGHTPGNPAAGFLDGDALDQYTACNPKIRCFQGQFCDSRPVRGSLYCGDNDELFPNVVYNLHTRAEEHALWYWEAVPDVPSRGTRFMVLPERGEEHRMVEAQVRKSVPLSDMHVLEIRKIVNDELRIAYDMRKNLLLNKVVLRPDDAWDNQRMERFAFYLDSATVPGGVAGAWDRLHCDGFGALASACKGTPCCGRGVYFARDASLVQQAALESLGMGDDTPVLHMVLCVLFTGKYTLGKPEMLGPPLDPRAVEGEHFHSLVDDMWVPQLFVVPDHAQAYPAYVISYKPRVSLVADDTTLQGGQGTCVLEADAGVDNDLPHLGQGELSMTVGDCVPETGAGFEADDEPLDQLSLRISAKKRQHVKTQRPCLGSSDDEPLDQLSLRMSVKKKALAQR